MHLTMALQVLGTFQHAVLRSREETELDAVLVFQLVSFLVDHHMDVLAVPTDMKEAVEDRLRMLEKPQVHNHAPQVLDHICLITHIGWTTSVL